MHSPKSKNSHSATLKPILSTRSGNFHHEDESSVLASQKHHKNHSPFHGFKTIVIIGFLGLMLIFWSTIWGGQHLPGAPVNHHHFWISKPLRWIWATSQADIDYTTRITSTDSTTTIHLHKPSVFNRKPSDLVKSHISQDSKFIQLNFFNRLYLKLLKLSQGRLHEERTFLLRIQDVSQDSLAKYLKQQQLWHVGRYLSSGSFLVTCSWNHLLLGAKMLQSSSHVEYVPFDYKMPHQVDIEKFVKYENWVQWSRGRPEDTCPVKERSLSMDECDVPQARFHISVDIPKVSQAKDASTSSASPRREKMMSIARSMDIWFHSQFHDGFEFSYSILENGGKIIFALNGSNKVLALASQLEKHPYVHWISIQGADGTHRVQNRYASQIVQSFDHPTETKLWKRGLTGLGQTIGVGDTGLDYYHCFFYDSANEIPQSQRERKANPKGPSRHRKISAFWELQDKKDSTDGHGTHVCGTAAGEAASIAVDDIKAYNSLSYRSKLAFADAGCDTKDGCTCPSDTPCECDLKPNKKCEKKFGVVYLPSDLNDGYFPWFYSHGVRIQSNSWGTGYYRDFNFGYSFSSAEIDRFVWNHKDFLPLYAAGNSGGSYGYSSLTSEAESKNALTVGASMSNWESFKKGEQFTDYKKIIDTIRVELYQLYCVGEYEKSPVAHLMKKEERDRLCDESKDFKTEADCCDDDGTCGGKSRGECCGVQKYKPFTKIGFRCCSKCVIWEMDNEKSHFSPNNLATFTARGPTVDGRTKPDIVTVGDQILSSKSRGTVNANKCSKDDTLKDSMVRREGTSMATPVAAAAASLVRQFFVDGYFPHRAALQDGLPNAANQIIPSAALLKAMLIHSTRVLSGKIHLLSQHLWKNLQYQQGDKYRLNMPSFQGFGAIDLSTVLDEESTNHRIILPNPTKDAEISTDELHNHCMHVVTPKSEFKATLVWSDYPSSPASKIALVNDLDLVIVSPTGKVYYGNGINSHIGSTTSSPDYQNNVEQISISSPEEGYYNVIVRGHYIPRGPQPYALVISGDVRSSRHQDQCREIIFDLKGELSKYKTLTFTFGVGSAVLVPILLIASIFFFIQYRQGSSKRPYHGSKKLSKSEAADYILQGDANEGPGSGYGRLNTEEELPEVNAEGYTAMPEEDDTPALSR